VHNFSGSAATFDHFINQAQPNELMIDAYPISADVPAPTEYVPAAEAQKAGIVPFVSATDYNNKLQARFEGMITSSLRPAIQAAQKHKLPWWYVGQLHGSLCLDTGKYRARQGNAAMERPPSPEEIRASINLALAYGAKGIFYFIFHTQAYPDHGGCSAVAFPGIVALGTENRTPNHSSAINRSMRPSRR
jgi:hypothetical protein